MNFQTTVFITGAASGIGLQVAQRYAFSGANLGLFDLNVTDEAREKIEQSALSKSQKIQFYQADVTDSEALSSAVDQARQEVGYPTLALHCAGINLTGPFEHIPKGQFEKVVQVNLFGSRNFAEAVIPLLSQVVEKNNAVPRLVFVASLAGIVGNFGYASYCASKFAVIGLAETLRIELKPKGIKVQVICPPEVDTPMVHEEHLTIHPATLKLKLMAGALSLDAAVDGIMKGLNGRSFYIIPGKLAKMTYWMNRLVPNFLSQKLVDNIVEKVLKNPS